LIFVTAEFLRVFDRPARLLYNVTPRHEQYLTLDDFSKIKIFYKNYCTTSRGLCQGEASFSEKSQKRLAFSGKL